MNSFLFVMNTILPIFLLILLGILLKKFKLVNDVFIRQSSIFVFNVCLPALIFIKLSDVAIDEAFDAGLIITSLLIILLTFAISWMVSLFVAKSPRDKGAFIQGSFRSNFAIIGLAVIAGFAGEEHLGKAALLLAFIMILFNILAVIALTVPMNKYQHVKPGKTVIDVFTNPLILAAIVALPFSIFQWTVWTPIKATLDLIGEIALPLALIGIGATIKLKNIGRASVPALIASFLKIIVFPFIAVVIGYFIGLSNVEMMILFVLFASPTAIASFVMAEAMNSNSQLAGDIIAISTLFSVITISSGIILLSSFNLI